MKKSILRMFDCLCIGILCALLSPYVNAASPPLIPTPYTPRAKVCTLEAAPPLIKATLVYEAFCATFGKLGAEMCKRSNPYPSLNELHEKCGCLTNCDELWGDPHFVTADGLRFDFQAAGDFALIENEQLTVQVRLLSFGSSTISYVQGVAFRAGQTTLSIDYSDNAANPQIVLNGESIELNSGDWYEFATPAGFVQKSDSSFRVRIALLADLIIRRNFLAVELNDQFSGVKNGLLGDIDGNPLNDLVTADGTVIDPSDKSQLYINFAEDWRRDGERSLFPTPLPDNDRGFDWFNSIPDFNSLDPGVLQTVYNQCLELGVTPGRGLDECIYDLAITGDASLAETALNLSAAVNQSVSPFAYSDNDITVFDLTTGDSVNADIPQPGAGKLERANNIDEYRLGISGDQTRLLVINSPCRAGNTLKVLMMLPNNADNEASMSCDAVINITADVEAIRVFSPYGEQSDYSFSLITPIVFELGAIVLGQRIEGTLERTQVVRGTLNVPVDSLLYFDALGDDCGATWTVKDSTDAAVDVPKPSCESIGPVRLSGTAPFVIQLEGAASSPIEYQFRVIDPRAPLPVPNVSDPDDIALSIQSATVPAGAAVNISWTGSSGEDDFITIAALDQTDTQFLTRAFVSGSGNQISLIAPGIPAEYEIRYIAGNSMTVVAQTSLTVNAVAATLDTIASAVAGSDINVQWTGPGNANDYISIARAEQLPYHFESRRYVNADTDQVTLTLPGIPGDYEIRYVMTTDFQVVTTIPFTVIAAQATLAAPASALAGSDISVQWTGPGNANDYVSIASAEQLPYHFQSRRYVKADADQVMLTLPGIPGDYEIRYVMTADFQVVTTIPFTVIAAQATLVAPASAVAGSDISVQWTGPGNANDYISIASAEQLPYHFETRRYVRADSDQVTLTLPAIAGNYEIRYVMTADFQIVTIIMLTVLPGS